MASHTEYTSAEFETLFRLQEFDLGIGFLERIFGTDAMGIFTSGVDAVADSASPTLQADPFTAATTATTWFNTAISFFNLACLLVVVILVLWSILTVVFDTAKDGSTFGSQTDTRYTMLRVISGAIFFIPVSGGFSIAQVILLFCVIQGTSLGNAVWSKIAEIELAGGAFVQPPRNAAGAEDILIGSQFSSAYGTLVRGHLCALALNDIATTLLPPTGPDAANPAPIQPDLDTEIETRGKTRNGTVHLHWRDTTGVIRGTRNLCGSVRHTAPVQYISDPSDPNVIENEFFRSAMTNAATNRMNIYANSINSLSNAALATARQIRAGEVDVDVLSEGAIDAISDARIDYLTGVQNQTNLAFEDISVAELADELQQRVSADGWMMAAAWQRGIGRAVSEQRNTSGDFEIKTNREINAARFLVPNDANGWLNTGFFRSETVNALLNTMNVTQEAWNTVEPTVVARAMGEISSAPTPLGMGGAEDISGTLGDFAQYLQDVLSPRDGGSQINDPMVDITEYGFGLVQFGGIVMGAGAVADLAGTGAAFIPATRAAAPVLDAAADYILYPVGWTLLLAGFFCSSILPLVPVLYFLSAVAKWFILIIESMFAVPLAIMSMFLPSRDGTFLGVQGRIVLAVFGLIMRPLFAVLGLFIGMLVIALMMDFAFILFQSMTVMIAPSASILNIVTMIGVVVVSVIVTFYIVLLGSQLIPQLGDSVMAWLGAAIPSGSATAYDGLGGVAGAQAGVGRTLPTRITSPAGMIGTSKGRSQAAEAIGNRGPRPTSDAPKRLPPPRR